MLTEVFSAKCEGIEATLVTVEVDVVQGIGIHLVGLADVAVKESLLRTITALQSLEYHIPGRKIVINLAPADIYKKGSSYDLPIAIGILAASGQMEAQTLSDYVMMGELGLDGSVRPVAGVLPAVEMAAKRKFRACIVPYQSAMEAVDVFGIDVYGVKNLSDVVDVITGKPSAENLLQKRDGQESRTGVRSVSALDFSEIIGQEGAKRGLEIAAAGGHNVIMLGPPGTGKSSMANALAGILPKMSLDEALQTSKIYSVAGRTKKDGGLIWNRPFRAPHLSVSIPAMIGGGSDSIMPGEISLAHNGVLFIDEFGEAPKRLVETLRAPMEDRKVVISRLKQKVEYPSSFMLVAASNPCPCGYYGEGDRCICSPSRRSAYLSKLSGPLMDRIDIHLWLHVVDTAKMVTKVKSESSADIAARVEAAREVQRLRFRDEEISTNSEMNNKHIQRYCPLSDECTAALKEIMDKSALSMRAFFRIIKVSRTIADLDGAENILPEHIMEAASYRFLDKTGLNEY